MTFFHVPFYVFHYLYLTLS